MSLVQNRSCDGCTACCKTHGVAGVTIRGEWCQHCTPERNGCAIYANRPLQCGAYKCMWLLGAGPDSWRPDRIGIVTSVTEISLGDEVHGVLTITEVNGGEIDHPDVQLLIRDMVANEKIVYLVRDASREKIGVCVPKKYLEDPKFGALTREKYSSLGFTLETIS